MKLPPGYDATRLGDASPLTDRAEVQEARRILSAAPGFDPGWVREVEAYDSAEELGAARDRELWGDAPFEED